MKAIVTIRNADGTFNEVGMNTCAVLGPYVRKSLIRKRAREFAKDKSHRIEYYADSILVDKPLAIDYI
jgi:hypothetical protein